MEVDGGASQPAQNESAEVDVRPLPLRELRVRSICHVCEAQAPSSTLKQQTEQKKEVAQQYKDLETLRKRWLAKGLLARAKKALEAEKKALEAE